MNNKQHQTYILESKQIQLYTISPKGALLLTIYTCLAQGRGKF